MLTNMAEVGTETIANSNDSGSTGGVSQQNQGCTLHQYTTTDDETHQRYYKEVGDSNNNKATICYVRRVGETTTQDAEVFPWSTTAIISKYLTPSYKEVRENGRDYYYANMFAAIAPPADPADDNAIDQTYIYGSDNPSVSV